ncbi:MAG: metallophosphoesterase [Gammaproteobacteria bacterium]|nr:metallophosphoesterase [Gammaproteobacteria bacterium]
MKCSNNRLPWRKEARTLAIWTSMLFTVLLLAACGGGASTSTDAAVVNLECDPNNSATFSECGSLMVALTDADGDFLNYTVDVLSLKLETANGRIVETLPRKTRINFTDYVDLTELVTVATIPPATYVSGTITLDYSDAEIFVEADDMAKAAIVTDIDNNPLAQTELKIRLSNRDPLHVVKGRPALLQLDFDLDASHTVDIVATPATAMSEQFIVAEVSPVDQKNIRVRGPLANVNVDEMTYTVALRPFHDRDGDFGRLKVHVTNDTEFEVDETPYVGSEGLRALSAAGVGTPTIAQGTLNVAEREFTANIVLAGSSVPGIDRDAVKGNVITRNGNFLTVRGATIIASDRRAHFHDDVIVEVGPDTRVFKDGYRASDLGIDAISVGQRVTVRGSIAQATTDALSPQILFDATNGAVRMHVTHLLGIVNTVMPGQTDITLHGIDRRRVQIFDFSGTGTTAADDADPANYEIATGNLVLANFAAGKPIVAYGFPTAFGTAPPDFTGRTVIDYTDVRSVLGVGWGSTGTLAPFTSMGSDGLVLNNQNPDIDQRHHIKNGPVLIDLTTLDSNTTIVPRVTDRGLFYIKSDDSLRQYSDFADFVDDLTLSLDGATAARSMHARGKYDSDTNTFTAYRIGVYLLEP